MNDAQIKQAFQTISNCDDPQKLKQIGINARVKGLEAVAHAADLRRYEVLPSEEPGSLEFDVWRSIHALEGTLTNERGKTTRLARTRQKIGRVGELVTIRDLIMDAKPSEGFHMLIDRQMTELTFEAVATRHPERFDQDVIVAATTRLDSVRAGASADV